MQFRKKPVVIEAFQFQPRQPTSVDEAPAWLIEAVVRGDFLVVDGVAHITTLEGIMAAQPGDWIIRGVKGEIYPCKPDIFTATYEAADQQPAPGAAHAGYSTMRPHQQRVVDEKVELDEKHRRLRVFLIGDVFGGLDEAEQRRLQAQVVAMKVYSDILGERIAAFAPT